MEDGLYINGYSFEWHTGGKIYRTGMLPQPVWADFSNIWKDYITAGWEKNKPSTLQKIPFFGVAYVTPEKNFNGFLSLDTWDFPDPTKEITEARVFEFLDDGSSRRWHACSLEGAAFLINALTILLKQAQADAGF